MTAPAAKTCCMCHKDVSNAKRVKDPHGHYYCATCHEAALRKRQGAAGVAKAAAASPAVKVPVGRTAVAAAPPSDDDLPMVPLATTPVPDADEEEAPKKAPAKIPEYCPNCDAKTLAGRRFCIKCNRDLTQMDKVVALKKEEAAGPSREEKVASAVGFVLKICLWVFCIAVLAFILWGIYLQVKPIDTFEDYPTTRERVVRDFLKHINEGSEKSLDKAFLLVSFRERTTNSNSEDVRWKQQFRKMREDFTAKYGADWHSKYQLENAGSNDDYADDEVDFKLKLGEDTYKIATQVQIAVDVASVNMIRPSKVKPEYPENGKNHFGILDVSEYKVRPKRTMDERLGITARQRPDF